MFFQHKKKTGAHSPSLNPPISANLGSQTHATIQTMLITPGHNDNCPTIHFPFPWQIYLFFHSHIRKYPSDTYPINFTHLTASLPSPPPIYSSEALTRNSNYIQFSICCHFLTFIRDFMKLAVSPLPNPHVNPPHPHTHHFYLFKWFISTRLTHAL